MWVLEARADAEKVWYPVVWEETKDASNVIDYNINKEVTIDTTSIFNANNETTTWEATLVYWVNAPQILEKTSIHQVVSPDKDYWKVYASISGYRVDDSDWHSWMWTPSITEQWGQYVYSLWDYFNWYYFLNQKALLVPETWMYQVNCTYYSTVNQDNRKYEVYLNENKIKDLQDDWYYWQHWSAYPTESFIMSANKWDKIAVYMFYRFPPLSPWASAYANLNITLELIKL